MKCEWRVYSIGEIAEKVAMGPFGSNIKVETFVNDGVPIISGAHLKGTRLEEHSFNYITEEHAEKLKNSIVYPGDIIFTHAGNIGQVALIPYDCKYKKYMISQRQFYLRCNTGLALPEFVVYYFHSRVGRHKLLANVSQVGVPSIAQPASYLKSIKLPLPPIDTQKKIVNILTYLEDKIELNNKINANLEAQAQAIFKSWFVDFEPLQDGEFVDSELGPIPKGWQVKKLIDICAYSTDRIKIDGCSVDNYISTENMLPNKKGKTNASSLPSVANVTMYRPNDILISNIRPYFRKIWLADCVGGCSNDVLAIRASNNRDSSYLYNLLFDDDFFNYATNTSKGTKMPRGDKSAILAYPFAYPQDTSIIYKFSNIHKAIAARVAVNQKENDILTALRDTLLPKLMSGEIEVPIV